jgi:hypothetical protein
MEGVHMKTALAVLALAAAVLAAGCKFGGDAMMVDKDGRFYYGKVKYDAGRAGSITFPDTPFGELSGPFTLEPTNPEKPVVTLDRIPLKSYSGRAALSNGVGPCLDCQITADFDTQGAGDLKMTGCGTCRDKAGKTYDISFE